jgi:hypothetical protein
VADRLLVRLGPPVGPGGELKIWFQRLVEPDLGLSLVIDYPQSMSYVTQEMVSESKQPGSVWLDRAVENLAAQTPADCFQVIHEESGLRYCAVGDAYDSSRALLLDRLLPDTTENGCLVAGPGPRPQGHRRKKLPVRSLFHQQRPVLGPGRAMARVSRRNQGR